MTCGKGSSCVVGTYLVIAEVLHRLRVPGVRLSITTASHLSLLGGAVAVSMPLGTAYTASIAVLLILVLAAIAFLAAVH